MRDAAGRLNRLIAQIVQYPVQFMHDARLAERVAAVVYIPESCGLEGGVPLKPIAVSRTVRRFTGVPFNVWFDGGCPITTGVGSCGMHFVDVDGHPFFPRGEHEQSYTSNHSEFLGLLRALEVVVKRNWHQHGDYIHVRRDS